LRPSWIPDEIVTKNRADPGAILRQQQGKPDGLEAASKA
jgi:hypothetical protein